MTRKRRRSAKRRTNAAGLTALALCFTRQLQLQPPTTPAVDVAGKEPSPGCPTADDAAADDANLVFSPVSVYAALALLAAGACGGTLEELLDALGGDSHDDVVAFSRHAGERALADRSQSGGPTIAVGEINGSLAAKTNKHVDSIIDPCSVNTLTTLVLTSAIYFEGRWESPFPKAQTVVNKFHRLDGSTADVPFMCSARSQYIAVRNGYKVLKLPYRSEAPPPPLAGRRKGSSAPPSESKPGDSDDDDDDKAPKYSLCVFLPDERDGLKGLIEKMASGAGFWHYRLPTSQVPVGALRLPKFKLSVSGSVKEVLSDKRVKSRSRKREVLSDDSMGIKSAFVAGEADLADMAAAKRDEEDDAAAGTPLLYVSDVCHKVVLEVNEGGTLVRGTTASYMLSGASAVMDQQATVDFVADHPFLFFVIEEVSHAIVFVGRVLDPSISG